MSSLRWLVPAAAAAVLVAALATLAISAVSRDNNSDASTPAPSAAEATREYTTVTARGSDVVVPTDLPNGLELSRMIEFGRLGPWVALTGPNKADTGRCLLVQSSVNRDFTSSVCASDEEIALAPRYVYQQSGGQGFLAVLTSPDSTVTTVNGRTVEASRDALLLPFDGAPTTIATKGASGEKSVTVSTPAVP